MFHLFLAEITCSGQNTLFRPKYLVFCQRTTAETGRFCRRIVLAEILLLTEVWAFCKGLFWVFRVSAKKLFRLTTTRHFNAWRMSGGRGGPPPHLRFGYPPPGWRLPSGHAGSPRFPQGMPPRFTCPPPPLRGPMPRFHQQGPNSTENPLSRVLARKITCVLPW